MSPIASAFDRHPGDAEAAGAAAEIAEARGLLPGSLLRFVSPERGYWKPTLAVLLEVQPSGMLLVEALLDRSELLLAPFEVWKGGAA